MKAKVMRTQERHNVAQGVGGRGDESDRWTERHERERERKEMARGKERPRKKEKERETEGNRERGIK